MAKEKKSTCRICGKRFKWLAKHLKITHHVTNEKERRIICQWATGRIFLYQMKCPLPGCSKDVKKVTRHLTHHKELSKDAMANIVQKLKRDTAIHQLKELRAEGLQLASNLDEDHERTEDDSIQDNQLDSCASDDPSPGGCNEPLCVRVRAKLKQVQAAVNEAALKKQLAESSNTIVLSDDEVEDPTDPAPRKKKYWAKTTPTNIIVLSDDEVEDPTDPAPRKKKYKNWAKTTSTDEQVILPSCSAPDLAPRKGKEKTHQPKTTPTDSPTH